MSTSYYKKITLNTVDITSDVSSCSLNLQGENGADSLTITLPMFNDLRLDIADYLNNKVVVYFEEDASGYHADNPWFIGLVTNASLSEESGLTLTCASYLTTILGERKAFGRFGEELGLDPVRNVVGEVLPGGNLGAYWHYYVVVPCDESGVRYTIRDTTAPGVLPAIKVHFEDERIRGDIISHSAGNFDIEWATTATTIGSGNNIKLAVPGTPNLEGIPMRTVRLTWDDDPKVTAWRVYKLHGNKLITDPVGSGVSQDVVALAWVKAFYVEVTTPEFIDNGTHDWVNNSHGELDKTDPYWDTYRIPFLSVISDWDAEGNQPYEYQPHTIGATVRYLMHMSTKDTDYADIYNPNKIDVPAQWERGEAVFDNVLDDLDYETDQKVSLLDAIKTLASYSGNLIYGIDRKGEFFFRKRQAKDTPANYEIDITQRDEGALQNPENKVVVRSVERSVTRDDVSGIDIVVSDRVKEILAAEGYEDIEVESNARGILTVTAYGIRTPEAVHRITQSIRESHKSTFGQWNISLSNLREKLFPGNLVEVKRNLDSYVMEIQSIRYDLAEVPEVSLTCGEPDLFNLSIRERNKVIDKLASGNTYKSAVTGAGNYRLMKARQQPIPVSGLYPVTGVSNIPAPLDHQHGIDVGQLSQIAGSLGGGIKVGRIILGGVYIDDLLVKFWDPATESWSGDYVNVKFPYHLSRSTWNNKTIYYAVGCGVSYTTTGAGGGFRRKATQEGVSEIQNITPMYWDYELILVGVDHLGEYVDLNWAGRQYAAVED